MGLGNFCDKVKENPSSVSAFVLDMHDKQVKTLAEIDLPAVETAKGLAVGLAIAEQYLRRPGGAFEHTPIALLTGFSYDSGLDARIKKLREIAPLWVLRKQNGETAFRKFLQELPHPEDLAEGFRIALKVLEEWGFTAKGRAAALGYRMTTSESAWPAMLSPNKIADTFDVPDRVDVLLAIKSKLEAIFGPAADVQSAWLREPQELLDGRSPFALIASGHAYEAAHVLGLLERITG